MASVKIASTGQPQGQVSRLGSVLELFATTRAIESIDFKYVRALRAKMGPVAGCTWRSKPITDFQQGANLLSLRTPNVQEQVLGACFVRNF